MTAPRVGGCGRRPSALERRAAFMVGTLMIAGWSDSVAWAQSRPSRLSFRSSIEVATEGLRLPAPPGAIAVGLPPPRLRTYRDGAGRLMEMQEPRDYWISEQFRGRWQDEAGLRMTLAVPLHLLPSEWPRPHVQPSEYAAAMGDAAPPRDENEWIKWAETWASAPLERSPQALRTPSRIAEAWLHTFRGSAPLRRGLAFRVRPNAFDVDTRRWFYVLFEVEEGGGAETLEREIVASFLPNIAVFARPSRDETRTAEKSPGNEPDQPTNDADALALSRQRVVDSIRGQRDWWHLETPHYVVASDLKGSRASTVRQIQEDIEPLRGAFAAFAPPTVSIRAVSVMRIFADGDDYVKWVGPDRAWSGGMWIPDRGELVIRAREWGSMRERREWLVGTVYHEAFHQYLHYAFGGQVPAVWFNEGHAVFFEGAEIREGRVTFDEVPRYAAMTHKMVVENRLDISSAIRLSYRDLYEESTSLVRSENYARCWVLVYFLRKHAEAAPDRPFAEMTDRYLVAFRRTGNNEKSVAEALGTRSIADLEAAIIEFWKSTPARREARRFDPLAPK